MTLDAGHESRDLDNNDSELLLTGTRHRRANMTSLEEAKD